MADSLYTVLELVEKLKSLDTQLDAAISRSDIDTGQSKHSVALSIRTLREQYEKYAAMLQRQDPITYQNTFGKSVIQFRGPAC